MVFVWRGSGITVPIFLFISGWIMSFWFEDTRLGNYPFLGWSMLWAGIVLTLQGAAVWGGGTPDPETGEIPFRRGHDFFWIPVLFWGVGFIGLSIWLINKEPAPGFTSSTNETTVEAYSDQAERTVNIYNPYEDSVDVLVSDLKTKEEIIEATIPPNSTRYKTFKCRPYYLQVNGSETKEKMRVHQAETHYSYEYDELWYILGGAMDMVLVDVTDVCDSTVTRPDIYDINWQSKIVERYNGKQIIEPYMEVSVTKKPIIYGVGDELPLTHKKRERIYTLIPVSSRTAVEEEYLDEWIIDLCY